MSGALLYLPSTSVGELAPHYGVGARTCAHTRIARGQAWGAPPAIGQPGFLQASGLQGCGESSPPSATWRDVVRHGANGLVRRDECSQISASATKSGEESQEAGMGRNAHRKRR